MSEASVRIELDVVEAAARQIRTMLDDMAAPTARLEAVLQQVQASAYGTDALGKALLGGGSSVGGLVEHQQQVLQGIHHYLQNSGVMAENLLLMCQRNRANEDQLAAELRGVLVDGGPPAAVSGRPAPASVPFLAHTAPVHAVPETPAAPAPAQAPVVAPTTYQDPGAPTLDYNQPRPEPVPHGGGGGGRQQLI